MGLVRFKVFDEGDEARIAAVRDALGENDFEAAWAEGAALPIEGATAYALRGRGERKRASSGWASLTRAELDVVKLVSEGLGNKGVYRLFTTNDWEPTGIARFRSGVRDSQSSCRTMRNRH
jgi:hypothetical protein